MIKQIEFLKEIEEALLNYAPKQKIRGFSVVVILEDCDVIITEEGEDCYDKLIGILEGVKFNMMADRRRENACMLDSILEEE
jgi:hypothetical protein